MTVLEHLREILAKSIAGPLAEVGIELTDDRSGYTVAHYAGRKGDFLRTVTVVRDKWWSRNRGRFTIFLGVERLEQENEDPLDKDAAEIPLSNLMGRETSDWKIWASDDALPFIEQLGSGIREHRIPWLERVSDPDGFAQWKQDEGC